MKKLSAVFVLFAIIITPIFSSCGNSPASIAPSNDPSNEPVEDIIVIDNIELSLSNDMSYYNVSGVSNEAVGEIFIPAEFNGLPIINILDRAFSNATEITSVIISEGIKTIGGNAFANCSSLETIKIPQSVQKIGSGAYIDCTSLYTVEIADRNEGDSLLSKSEPSAKYCSAVAQAEESDDTTEIDDILYIEGEAFKNTQYYNDENNWVDGVLYVGKHLIATRPDQVPEVYDIKDSTKSIANEAFTNCVNLKAVNIPSSVKFIGDSAFWGCENLTEIEIPSGVLEIGSIAFENCTQLSSISLPNTVRRIGSSAFYETAYYNDISNWNIESSTRALYINRHFIQLASAKSGTEYFIKSGTITIADAAFSYVKGISGVTVPSSVSRISYWAFYSCENLKYVDIPPNIKEFGDEAFVGCSSLETITIPNGINEISYQLFRDCISLSEIVIPNSVKKIHDMAFNECSNLKSATFGNGLREIGNGAFFGCKELQSIELPNSLLSIGTDAFGNCLSLSDITLPSGVCNIGSGAFFFTAYYDDESNWENDFLYIGNHLIKANHHTIRGERAIRQGTTDIAEYAFSDCGEITDLTIPESVSLICPRAFRYISSATRIHFEDSKKWMVYAENGLPSIDFASLDDNKIEASLLLTDEDCEYLWTKK